MSLFFDWNCINASLEKCILSIYAIRSTENERNKINFDKGSIGRMQKSEGFVSFLFENWRSQVPILLLLRKQKQTKICSAALHLQLWCYHANVFSSIAPFYLFDKWNEIKLSQLSNGRLEQEKEKPMCIISIELYIKNFAWKWVIGKKYKIIHNVWFAFYLTTTVPSPCVNHENETTIQHIIIKIDDFQMKFRNYH